MDSALLIHWLFSCLALLIMMARLLCRRVYGQPFNTADYLTVCACFCVLARLGLIHVVLIWGTNNMTAAMREEQHFTPYEVHQCEVGSKLLIANRFFYNSYLWLQKFVLLDLYRRLVLDLPFEMILIRSLVFVLFATYVVVQVLTFSECKPFHLYWQVLPDPGPCAQAQLQLVVVGVLNIITDLMLLVMPVPVLVTMKASWRRKAQLLSLFTLGIFIIVITIIRLPINSLHKYSQVNRTTWASTELLTSGMVVNAPTLYGLWNMMRRGRVASLHRRAQGHDGNGRSAKETIGGNRESCKTGPKQRPTCVQTRDFVVSEHMEARHIGNYFQLPEEGDCASKHSSRREILQEV